MIIRKMSAVPIYAKKLSSGLGKKNNVINPRAIIVRTK